MYIEKTIYVSKSVWSTGLGITMIGIIEVTNVNKSVGHTGLNFYMKQECGNLY